MPKKAPQPRKPKVAKKIPTNPAALYTFSTAVAANTEAHTDLFPNPPYLDALKKANEALQQANAAAENHGKAEMKVRYTAMVKVKQLLIQHAGWVQALADATTPEAAHVIITSSGFAVSKVGSRPPKPTLAAREGKVSGTVVIEVLAVLDALMYYYEYSSDGKTWQKAVDDNKSRVTFGGLTASQVYYFRFRAWVRKTGYTDYSQVVSCTVR